MVQFHMLRLDFSLPSYAALLHRIATPYAPWCIARLYLFIDTQLHGILPWADINRNGNRSLDVFASIPPDDER